MPIYAECLIITRRRHRSASVIVAAGIGLAALLAVALAISPPAQAVTIRRCGSVGNKVDPGGAVGIRVAGASCKHARKMPVQVAGQLRTGEARCATVQGPCASSA